MVPAATASLHRRIRFAASCRYRIDAALLALGLWRSFGLSTLPYATGTMAFDLLEFLRTRGQASQPGRPHLAALAASLRLSQDPRYRQYWYDAQTHSLVGLHLGIDLHRYRGRYFVIESNLSAGMRPKRRQLYNGDLDPLLVRLITVAEAWNFETIILCRRRWSEAQAQEIERANRDIGIEVIAATVVSDDPRGRSATTPMLAIPQPLRSRTLYVIFDPMWSGPLTTFVHDKACVGSWLGEAITAAGDPGSRLACVPTSDRIVLPSEPLDARWPNLVIKLADLDRARAVKMGRFATEDEARRELRVDDNAGEVPAVFELGRWRKVLNRAFAGFLRPIYQPFVPPEVEEDGRARKIRLHIFISPLVNTFLSAHGIVAAEPLPDKLAPGLVQNYRPYIVNNSTAGRYCRLESAIEDELRDLAEEFGRLAFRAISARFEISSGDCSADANRRSHWRAEVGHT